MGKKKKRRGRRVSQGRKGGRSGDNRSFRGRWGNNRKRLNVIVKKERNQNPLKKYPRYMRYKEPTYTREEPEELERDIPINFKPNNNKKSVLNRNRRKPRKVNTLLSTVKKKKAPFKIKRRNFVPPKYKELTVFDMFVTQEMEGSQGKAHLILRREENVKPKEIQVLSPQEYYRQFDNIRSKQTSSRNNTTNFLAIYPSKYVKLGWGGAYPRAMGCGFYNLGNTCFLNSILQILTYTPPFRGFIKPEIIEDRNACFLITEHMYSLKVVKHYISRVTDRFSISPKRLLNFYAQNLQPGYIFGEPQDAHECLLALLTQFEKEILTSLPGGRRNNDRFIQSYYNSSFLDTNPIKRIFYGKLNVHIKSSNKKVSRYVNYRQEDFCCLSLSCKKRSIDKCLQEFFSVTKLDDEDNMITCPLTEKKISTVKRSYIHTLPNVLSIHLKRFTNFGQKIGKRIYFHQELNMKRYVVNSRKNGDGVYKNDEDCMYDLCGIVIHYGSSMINGHYASVVKASNGFWYLCNDDLIEEMNESRAMSQNPYLLFYVKRTPQDVPNEDTYVADVDLDEDEDEDDDEDDTEFRNRKVKEEEEEEEEEGDLFPPIQTSTLSPNRKKKKKKKKKKNTNPLTSFRLHGPQITKEQLVKIRKENQEKENTEKRLKESREEKQRGLKLISHSTSNRSPIKQKIKKEKKEKEKKQKKKQAYEETEQYISNNFAGLSKAQMKGQYGSDTNLGSWGNQNPRTNKKHEEAKHKLNWEMFPRKRDRDEYEVDLDLGKVPETKRRKIETLNRKKKFNDFQKRHMSGEQQNNNNYRNNNRRSNSDNRNNNRNNNRNYGRNNRNNNNKKKKKESNRGYYRSYIK